MHQIRRHLYLTIILLLIHHFFRYARKCHHLYCALLFVKNKSIYLGPSTRGVLEGGGPGGGSGGGVYPPTARLLCPSTRLYLGPSTRGRARGGRSGGGFTPPRHGCCVQAPDYIWDPARGGVLEGGGPGGGLAPPGTAAVSKHQTISGTQHEGACSRGGVNFVFVRKSTLPRTNLASLCPGRREVRPRISTPLQHLRL